MTTPPRRAAPDGVARWCRPCCSAPCCRGSGSTWSLLSPHTTTSSPSAAPPGISGPKTACLVNFPFIAGLAAGFVVGAVIAGGRVNTWLAWLIAATGVGIASVPLLPFDIAVLTGAVLASAGLGIGLSGRLVALLRLASGNRISRAAALFQVAQNLGYGVGIGVPMALILALGEAVSPDARVHLFLSCSLILLVTGLVLALGKPKKRVAAQRSSDE